MAERPEELRLGLVERYRHVLTLFSTFEGMWGGMPGSRMYENEKFFKSRRTKVTPATCVQGIARGSRSRSHQEHTAAHSGGSLSHRFCSEKRPAVVHQCRAASCPALAPPGDTSPGLDSRSPAGLSDSARRPSPGKRRLRTWERPQKKALDSPRECERTERSPSYSAPRCLAASRPQGHGPLPPGITAGNPLPEIKRQPMPGFPRRHARVPAHAKAESEPAVTRRSLASGQEPRRAELAEDDPIHR